MNITDKNKDEEEKKKNVFNFRALQLMKIQRSFERLK